MSLANNLSQVRYVDLHVAFVSPSLRILMIVIYK